MFRAVPGKSYGRRGDGTVGSDLITQVEFPPWPAESQVQHGQPDVRDFWKSTLPQKNFTLPASV